MSRLAALLAAAFVVTGPARVASAAETGTGLTGARKVRATFLSRPVGARPVGMGEAWTALADDASAAAWNPAGLGQLDSFGAVAMYDHVGNNLGMRYLAAALPAGPGVAGVSLTVMSYGSYDVFDAHGTRTGTRSLWDAGFTAAWATKHPGWLGVRGWSGVSIEVAREAVGESAVGAGLGTQIPLGEEWTVGAAAQHLGPSRGGYALPAVARLGAAWTAREHFRFAADGALGLADRQAWVAVGGEWTVGSRLALRAGYRHALDARRPGGLVGVTGGVGFRLGGVGVDYAYQPFGELTTSHKFALVYGAASGPAEAP